MVMEGPLAPWATGMAGRLETEPARRAGKRQGTRAPPREKATVLRERLGPPMGGVTDVAHGEALSPFLDQLEHAPLSSRSTTAGNAGASLSSKARCGNTPRRAMLLGQ